MYEELSTKEKIANVIGHLVSEISNFIESSCGYFNNI